MTTRGEVSANTKQEQQETKTRHATIIKYKGRLLSNAAYCHISIAAENIFPNKFETDCVSGTAGGQYSHNSVILYLHYVANIQSHSQTEKNMTP